MQLIARIAQGSMRDAVGLLDQLVPLATGPITLEGARSLLGIADPRLLDSLLDDVLVGRAAEALEELNRVYSAGAELRQVVRGLMEGCRDRLVAALTRRDNASARRLSSVLDALLHLDGEVRRHAEPRFLVEATLARLAVELGTATASVDPPVAASTPAPVVATREPAAVAAAQPVAPTAPAATPTPTLTSKFSLDAGGQRGQSMTARIRHAPSGGMPMASNTTSATTRVTRPAGLAKPTQLRCHVLGETPRRRALSVADR